MMHCLHGAVGSFRDWRPLQAALSIPVRALDLWRFFDGEIPNLAQAGRVIAGNVNEGDLLLGYSLGGRLALHALLAAPEKWRAAVIVSAHPGLTKGHEERLAADQKWGELARQDWPGFLEQWNAQAILSGSPVGMTQASRDDQDAVARSFADWSLGRQQDLRPLLPSVTCPVLWLTGDKDQKFSSLAVEAVELLPSARHQVLPGCGHRLPWESPGPFLAAVETFLNSIRISPPTS